MELQSFIFTINLNYLNTTVRLAGIRFPPNSNMSTPRDVRNGVPTDLRIIIVGSIMVIMVLHVLITDPVVLARFGLLRLSVFFFEY